MIGHYAILRLKQFFRGFKTNPWNILLHLMYFFTARAYGWLFAELTNKAGNGDLKSFSSENIINYVLIFIVSMTLFRMIIPTYKPQKQILPKFYPLSKWQRYKLAVVSDFQKPFFFYMVLFVASYAFSLDSSKLWFLISGISILLAAQLIRRMLHYLFENRLKPVSYVYYAITMLIISLIILNINALSESLIYLNILAPVILFLIGYLIDCQVIEYKINTLSMNSGKGNYILKLLMNSNKARTPLMVAIVVKIFILAVDLYMFKFEGKHIFEGQLVYWLFASPLITFTYVFNNTWGFWKNIWLNFELRSGKYSDLMKFKLRMMFIPLIIDTVITIPMLLLSWDNYQFIVLFYFTSLIFLVCTSFVWSMLFPVAIKGTFQMKGSSSFVSSTVSMVAVILLSTILMNDWFYLLIPVYLIVAFVAYKLAIELHKDKKYVIANKLLKE